MVSWWLILPAHLKQWRQETKLRWPVCCLQLPHSQYRSVPVTGLGPPESRYRAPPSDSDRKSCLETKVYDLDSQEDLSVTSLLLNSDTSPSPRWNYTLTEGFDVFTPWSQVLVLVIWRKRVSVSVVTYIKKTTTVLKWTTLHIMLETSPLPCSRPITPPVPMALPNSSSLPLHRAKTQQTQSAALIQSTRTSLIHDPLPPSWSFHFFCKKDPHLNIF